MTTSTTTVEEFDPLDNPQVKAFYDGLRQRQGQVAADRYLLTVKPKPSGGMTATTPRVVTESRRTKEIKAAPTLTEPLPTRRSLADAYTFPDDKLPEEEERSESKPTVEGNATVGYTTPTSAVSQPDPTETTPSHPVSTTEPPAGAVNTGVTDMVDTAAKTEGSTAIVSSTNKHKRKPVRSTAEVKQAFEDALANFVAAGKPFLRTHVTRAAGLGASFYYTYPSLRTKVDATIANVGKTKPQAQSEVKTMSSEVNEAPIPTPVTTEPAVEEETVEPEAALTANTPVETDAGQLATAVSTAFNSNNNQ